jgi:GrpB-like predicted nucleotidyltransferase (UPF0157 family)
MAAPARGRAVIARQVERIEHVGSTSVPGLAAKQDVDIQVSVADLGDEDRYVPPCEAAASSSGSATTSTGTSSHAATGWGLNG